MKPKVFIGSSVEGLDVAYDVQENLEHTIEATVWSQGIFELSGTALDSLINTLDKCDFGIFVFSPDDIVKIRDNEYQAVRDNIIFELGLFIGKLGKKRCFILMPRSIENFRLPTDLLGITPATYNSQRQDGNLQAALGAACFEIQEAINKSGKVSNNKINIRSDINLDDIDDIEIIMLRILALEFDGQLAQSNYKKFCSLIELNLVKAEYHFDQLIDKGLTEEVWSSQKITKEGRNLLIKNNLI